MNNTTRFIESNNNKFVLRIYETHQDCSKVEYEHYVLLALKEAPLPFRIPQPVQTPDGRTYVKGTDGKIAALFYFLNGANPSLKKPVELYSFGKAAGRLIRSLEHIQIEHKPVYKPYYEIEHTHPRCPIDDVVRLCINPPPEFQDHSRSLLHIGEQLSILQKSIPVLKQLPHQLIHGDLNASNVLVDENGCISAILDFEFVTWDLRVMELAVCLSDIMNSAHDEEIMCTQLKAFLDGYGTASKLTADEICAIPALIMLRRLDVFIHFLGRYYDKIDSIDIVKKQIEKTVSKTGWLTGNKEELLHMCKSYLLNS